MEALCNQTKIVKTITPWAHTENPYQICDYNLKFSILEETGFLIKVKFESLNPLYYVILYNKKRFFDIRLWISNLFLFFTLTFYKIRLWFKSLKIRNNVSYNNYKRFFSWDLWELRNRSRPICLVCWW